MPKYIISDYDGALSENGHYTEKYYSLQSMIADYDPHANDIIRFAFCTTSIL